MQSEATTFYIELNPGWITILEYTNVLQFIQNCLFSEWLQEHVTKLPHL